MTSPANPSPPDLAQEVGKRSLPEAIAGPVAALVREAGHGRVLGVQALAGGGNNRVHRLDTSGGPLVLKHYFRHETDPRNRLAAEYAFLTFCAAHGISRVPKPIGADGLAGIALYSFVAGAVPGPSEEPGLADIAQAAALLADLRQAAGYADALALSDAAEACFTLADHVACVDRRLDQLAALLDVATGASVPAARAFLLDQLRPAWDGLRGLVAERARQEKPAGAGRILSPSDFGFHNALRTANGLVFFDFEYSGWDDPAKTLCDFVCQPRIPVPPALLPDALLALAEAVTSERMARTALLNRALLLLPLHRLKWCCIMLNEFKPDGGARRDFARGGDSEMRRRAQLCKASAFLRASLVLNAAALTAIQEV